MGMQFSGSPWPGCDGAGGRGSISLPAGGDGGGGDRRPSARLPLAPALLYKAPEAKFTAKPPGDALSAPPECRAQLRRKHQAR